MPSCLLQYHDALKAFRASRAQVQHIALSLEKLAEQLKSGAEALIVAGIDPQPGYFISPTYLQSVVTLDAASVPTADEIGNCVAAFQRSRADLHKAYALLTIEEQHDIIAPVKVGAGVP